MAKAIVRGRGEHLSPKEVATKKRKFLKEFKKHQGEWKSSADGAGVSVATIKHWMRVDEDFKDRVFDIDQSFVDEVEQTLFQQIRKGNINAIIFYMRCKAKDRGYVERFEDMSKIKADLKGKQFKLDFGDGE